MPIIFRRNYIPLHRCSHTSQAWKSFRLQSRTTKLMYSTTQEPSAAPLLSRLRDDLKTAMRARDTARLNVLRAILADITNSSKTSNPIKDDLSLLALLKKRTSSVKQSIHEFYAADRKDLVVKEEEQLKVLEEYSGSIKVLSENEARQVVADVVQDIRSNGRQLTLAEAMKNCVGPGGAFDGRMVEKSLVARLVKEEVAEKTL